MKEFYIEHSGTSREIEANNAKEAIEIFTDVYCHTMAPAKMLLEPLNVYSIKKELVSANSNWVPIRLSKLEEKIKVEEFDEFKNAYEIEKKKIKRLEVLVEYEELFNGLSSLLSEIENLQYDLKENIEKVWEGNKKVKDKAKKIIKCMDKK